MILPTSTGTTDTDGPLTEAEMLSALTELVKAFPEPMTQYIQVDPVVYAMVNAHIDFQGRNWRRIKREVNKAAKRARR